jgi:hypothetical protein
MSEESSTRGVFLSYAREDTEAARRIADALRGFGVEVWFDQSELRGGDAWDAKIKSQIRECALFVAIISANTQARGEGYFRREWKLAIERTHDMAAGDPVPDPARGRPDPGIQGARAGGIHAGAVDPPGGTGRRPPSLSSASSAWSKSRWPFRRTRRYLAPAPQPKPRRASPAFPGGRGDWAPAL